MGRLKGSKNGVASVNPIEVLGDVVRISIGHGMHAVVDASDYSRVSHLRWHAHRARRGGFYAVSNGIDGIHPPTTLHRLLAGVPGMDVDHKDRDGLNCRRENLRPATRTQNNANRISLPGSASQFKGVTWDKARGCWKALIQVHGKALNLGRFREECDAATAYNFAAHEAFGEFARFNN